MKAVIDRSVWLKQYRDLPLYFEPLDDNGSRRNEFLARSAGYAFVFGAGESLIDLARKESGERWTRAFVHMKLERSNSQVKAEPLDRLPGISGYFIGNDPQKWRRMVPHYGRVRYSKVYPGVDLVYHNGGRNVEYDFVVAPGGNPSVIQLSYDGADSMRLDGGGDLVLATKLGEVRQKKPRVYQQLAHGQVEVACDYRISGSQVTFALAGYDRNRELVIDPLVMVYSSLIGGTSTDDGRAVAVDQAGASRDFPLPSSACGIPASAQAYSLNVTVAPRGFLGFLTAWPSGAPRPESSTLNSLDGTVLANAAIVPAGANGAVSFYASQNTDMVVDVNGYFAPPGTGGLDFYTATPCRLVDTRGPNGSLGGPAMTGGSTRTFPLQSSPCGLPSGAAAYSLNFTVAPPGFLGYITAWPTGVAQPLVSTLNAPKGIVVANAALLPAGTNGAINVFTLNDTHVIVDTNGYFK
jgi:hypothetical protein